MKILNHGIHGNHGRGTKSKQPVASPSVNFRGFRGLKFPLTDSPENGPLYVGFSGGADSTALLVLAHEAHPKVRAIHFEHGIRGEESRRDALWCREFCSARGIELQEITLDVPGNLLPGENVEAAARRLRLRAWTQLAANGPIRVLLGHHAGDRAENLLIRLARGSNVSGLSSMRRRWQYGNVTFERPLLDFSREDIEEFLRGSGIADWRVDSTNTEEHYQRNFLRNQLLPQWYRSFPPAEKGLIQAAAALEQDADFIEQTAGLLANANLTGEAAPLSFWRKTHPALLPRLLRRWFELLGYGDYLPDHFAMERFAAQLNTDSTETRILHLNDDFELCFDRDEVWLRPRVRPEFEPVLWNWRNHPQLAGFSVAWGTQGRAVYPQTAVHLELNILYSEGEPDRQAEVNGALGTERPTLSGIRFDAALIPDELEITAPHPGDTMIPFGQSHHKKIAKLALDAKLKAREKAALRVLKIPGGGILWVPGLRRSNFAPVTAETTQILVINYTT